MNHRMRRIVETLACERRYGIADAKGAEYSGAGSTYQETGADTLNNFKSVASRIGGTPEQVLMTYLLKHIDSINTTVREAAETTDPGLNVYPKGEGIVSRLDDARNYLDLLECLLIDNGHIESHDAGLQHDHGDAVTFTPAEDVAAAEQYIRDYSPVIGVEPTRTSVGEDDPLCQSTPDMVDVVLPLEASVCERNVNQDNVPEGMIRGFDGVVRPKAKKDESVRGEQVQTPIYAQPTQDHLRYGETGELDG